MEPTTRQCPAGYTTSSGKKFICLEDVHEERHGHHFREVEDDRRVKARAARRLVTTPGQRGEQ